MFSNKRTVEGRDKKGVDGLRLMRSSFSPQPTKTRNVGISGCWFSYFDI
jgi:hypothetical protein